MILDVSAIVAVLTRESEGANFRNLIYDAQVVRISAAGYVEVGVVLDSRGLSRDLDQFLEWCTAQVEPVSESQAHIARLAYRRYGRGTGHPARLNYGDCFAYALAMERMEPLLFKGNDFSHTDVLVAA
jgi:ribonuclease VapC